MIVDMIKGFLFKDRKPLLTDMAMSRFKRGTWRLHEVYDLENNLDRCVRYGFVDKEPITQAYQIVDARASDPEYQGHSEIAEIRRVMELMRQLINR